MTIFFIGDSHYGHEAPCTKFTLANGSPLRPFSCAAECDEFQVKMWNETVNPTDKVYHLGDVTMSHKFLHILGRLNGEKVLIKGNHDTAKLSQYEPYFKDVRGSHQFDGMLLTHIPVHPDSLARWGLNVHGHLHANVVRDHWGKPDTRYRCVSVEQLNYTPISLDAIRQMHGLN